LVIQDLESLLRKNRSIRENYPFFYDHNDVPIPFNHPITLFNAIKLASNYLEKRYSMDPNMLEKIKISDIIYPFINDKPMTIIEFYNHIENLYSQDRFKSLVDQIQKVASNSVAGNPQPLGEFGNLSLNEIIISIKETNWGFNVQKIEATVHAAPLLINFSGYGLMLRSDMKYVHNRPLPPFTSDTQNLLYQQIKNRQLALFAFIGAPIALVLLMKTALGLKDMISIDLTKDSRSAQSADTASLLFFSGLKNKVPNWLKLLIKLIVLSFFLLKFLGLNILGILINIYYLKLYCYLSSTIAIVIQLLSLYFLHKFSSSKTTELNLSPVLPDFIKEWLKDLKLASSSKEGINMYKESIYIHITIFFILTILVYLV